jgi:hypothetical protein
MGGFAHRAAPTSTRIASRSLPSGIVKTAVIVYMRLLAPVYAFTASFAIGVYCQTSRT